MHLAWSGNQQLYGERMPSGLAVLGGGEVLLPGEVILTTGQTYGTPWLYGSHGVGVDAVTARFHEFLRARPQHPAKVRPVVCNVWEAVYFDHRLDKLIALADAAAAVGVERYVLDDGWFRHRRDDSAGLGDWYVDEGVWPNGLQPAHRARRRSRHGVRAVVRAGDGQPRLRPRPRPPRLDPAAPHRMPPEASGTNRCSTSATPTRMRLPPRTDGRDPHRVRHRLREVGPQPPTGRRAPPRRARRASTTRRSRSTGCSTNSRPGTRGWRSSRAPPAAAASTSASSSTPTGCGPATATTRSNGSRSSAGHGLLLPPELIGAHVGPTRSHTTERTHDLSLPCRPRRCSATSASSGTSRR